jgi:NDP-4-keto-2,6-dideoxyhexose 3-C-methyltransferase
MPIYSEIKKCRGCGSGALEKIWDGGWQYIVGFPEHIKMNELSQAPVVLVVCCECWLVQLKHSVEPDKLYRNFWYRSGTNEMMREALKDVVEGAIQRVDLKQGDVVVDIGCNDGTLFKYYPDGVEKIGFDPARNIQSPGTQKGNWEFICSYFDSALYPDGCRKAKIVTALAMFYDVEEPVEFVKDVARVLDDDGVFVVQMNYLPSMMENCCIDNVSHEHLCYYSLASLIVIFGMAGMRIFDAEANDVNGGSIRIYASKKSKLCTDSFYELHKLEMALKLNSLEPYEAFAKQVESRFRFLDLMLADLKKKNEVVYAYGASTRGTGLMYLLKNASVIKGVAERDPMKWGRYMVGSWLPIVSEEDARKQATVFLVLPYYFAPAIIQREKKWMQGGGKLLIPLPESKLLSASDVHQEWVEAERLGA